MATVVPSPPFGSVDARRPFAAKLWAGLLGAAALATGYLGLSAYGFLAPAAVLLLQSVLLWLGRGSHLFLSILAVNLGAEIVLDLVTSFGHGLGSLRLDIAGAALLANLATGGPLMSLLALPILASLWFSPAMRTWIRPQGKGGSKP